MYSGSAQGIVERVINVRYYYYYYDRDFWSSVSQQLISQRSVCEKCVIVFVCSCFFCLIVHQCKRNLVLFVIVQMGMVDDGQCHGG